MDAKDVVLSLTNNLHLLSGLAQRVRAQGERLSRNATFDELAKTLAGHFGAIEYVVLPALLRAQSRGLASDLLEVLVSHMSLKRRLAGVLAMNRKTTEFDTELAALCDDVQAQADREQVQLLPYLRQALPDDHRALLAGEVEAQVRARVGDAGLSLNEPITQPRVHDLLQEAQVVLASLPHRHT